MSYKCQVCNAKVQAGVAQRKAQVYYTTGPLTGNIRKEYTLCAECYRLLEKGIGLTDLLANRGLVAQARKPVAANGAGGKMSDLFD